MSHPSYFMLENQHSLHMIIIMMADGIKASQIQLNIILPVAEFKQYVRLRGGIAIVNVADT